MSAAPTIDAAAIDRVSMALSHSAASVARAAAIVNAGLVHVTDIPGTYLVRSVTDESRYYITTLTSCTCPSHVHRGHCKHQTAVLVRTLTTPGA
jgi:uncharacterized Zn finger protein